MDNGNGDEGATTEVCTRCQEAQGTQLACQGRKVSSKSEFDFRDLVLKSFKKIYFLKDLLAF